MKRLLFLVGLLVSFFTPNHAETKTDTIRFMVEPSNSKNDTLRYSFSNTVKDDIRIDWIAENDTKENLVLDENGACTQAISTKGEVSIYYSYEQSSGYSVQISWFTESVLDMMVKTGSTVISSINVSNCTALKHLKCDLNVLTSLDVSGCTSLTYLNCNHNLLTSLDVSGCTALKSLSCINNRLKDLNISNTTLEALYCGENQLTNLDVSGNTELEFLSCFNNRLTSLNVNGCTSLISLKVDQNQLESLNVSGCTSLTELQCAQNQLANLDVSGCTSLTELEYQDGQLENLNANGCSALTSLLCEQNQLMILDVSGCSALTEIKCGHNRLERLDVSDNTALEDLYCSENQLTDLNISNNIELRSLFCANNQLTDLVVSNNTSLVILSCENNHLPLSTLYNIDQQKELHSFNAGQQSDSVFLTIDQPLDLSSERALGDSLTSFQLSDAIGQAISSDFYAESNFTFQFQKPHLYRLTLQNANLNSHGPGYAAPVTFTWYVSVKPPEGYFTVDVVSNNTDWGTATITGNGIYKKDSTVTITAAPKEGFRFVNWTNGNEVFSTDSIFTFKVTTDLKLTANFKKLSETKILTVSVTSINTEWGSASLTGTGSYEEGSEVTITATPNKGYRFINWTKKDGTVFSTESVHTFAVTENLELTA
ncbi:MAG: hypothetical protein K2I87_00445, partial [Bacteroidales bacterium]|nr:hypothetical protein [Bacteroidales bacterium]